MVRVAHNKGKYGEKITNFKAGLPNNCKVHGLHNDWKYYETSKSCVCRFCLNERSIRRWQSGKFRLERLITDAKQHCKKTGHTISITVEDLRNKLKEQNNRCALSGIEFSSEAYSLNNISLDRKDSSKGYIIENVQLVTIAVNRMKSNFEESFFIEVCQKIASEAKGKKK